MRQAALVVRCADCDGVSVARCKRCDRPACLEHKPERSRRCAPCESELDRRLDDIKPVKVAGNVNKMVRKYGGALGVGGGGTIGVLTAFLLWAEGVFGGYGLILAPLYVALSILMTFGIVALYIYIGSLPFIGVRGTIAGTRWLRRKRTQRQFLAERPGRRLLPPAPVATEDDDPSD